ncbi:MAG: dihydropteroate synthase, partial [Sedimentisphaerales bacterium]|nr:dihydropteroate synthase [Sedimentisphaerales bacterium]
AGPSRKSFIGKILNITNPSDRIFGTAAAVAWCVAAGVHIVRVHNVREMAQVARIITAIRGTSL